ncbi:hypothetical protein GCM10027562_18840 [Arthrobacter pigmenti]
MVESTPRHLIFTVVGAPVEPGYETARQFLRIVRSNNGVTTGDGTLLTATSFAETAYCVISYINYWRRVMAAHCQVTGAEPGFGNNISHSHRRTRRRFDPNIQKKRYWVPSLRRNVTLQVSAKGIKTIDARGIDTVVAEIMARGVKL